MTDLDIGMNQRLCAPFVWDDSARLRPRQGDDRRAELEAGKDFGRYKDVDGDGIPYRTYPGTHPSAARTSRAAPRAIRYARYSERGAGLRLQHGAPAAEVRDRASTLVPQPVLRDAGAEAQVTA